MANAVHGLLAGVARGHRLFSKVVGALGIAIAVALFLLDLNVVELCAKLAWTLRPLGPETVPAVWQRVPWLDLQCLARVGTELAS